MHEVYIVRQHFLRIIVATPPFTSFSSNMLIVCVFYRVGVTVTCEDSDSIGLRWSALLLKMPSGIKSAGGILIGTKKEEQWKLWFSAANGDWMWMVVIEVVGGPHNTNCCHQRPLSRLPSHTDPTPLCCCLSPAAPERTLSMDHGVFPSPPQHLEWPAL